MHEEHEPQTCPHCDKVSVNKYALKCHIRNVHNNRPFRCHLCEKAFKRPITLKEHIAMHTGRGLYTCNYCPKTFNSYSNKHKHRKTMHPAEWLKDSSTTGLNS